MQEARRQQAARLLSPSSRARPNPILSFLARAFIPRLGWDDGAFFVLPQTLRRPAPNFLAAASFSHGIASPLFWPCHEAKRPCHANFFLREACVVNCFATEAKVLSHPGPPTPAR